MKYEGWLSQVKYGNQERIAKMLEEADLAQDMLRKKGYGWTGLSLFETVKQVPSQNPLVRFIQRLWFMI